jgi:5-methylthioadenosine/S-adenosylhomocysteine deaminase
MSADQRSLVLRGGSVLSIESGSVQCQRADVVIDGATITSVLKGGGADHFEGAQVHDVTGMCILPGLVDLHFHTALGKGKFDDLPLDRWITAWWYPILRAMDPEVAYWAGMLAYADAVRSGTTCVNDMSRQLPSLARAAADVGIRAVLSNTITEADLRLDGLSDTLSALDQMTHAS